MKICDNCGLDLTGTTLGDKKGCATLCLCCIVIDEHEVRKRR